MRLSGGAALARKHRPSNLSMTPDQKLRAIDRAASRSRSQRFVVARRVWNAAIGYFVVPCSHGTGIEATDTRPSKRSNADERQELLEWTSAQSCHADQRSVEAVLTGSNGRSSLGPTGSCAIDAACGARILKGRRRRRGDAVAKLQPPAIRAKRSAAAAIK